MKTPWIAVVLLGLGAMTCLDSPFPCPRYCWSHKQAVPDLTNEDMQASPDGRFDETCIQLQNQDQWYPPLPPFGFYGAETCLAGDWLGMVECRLLDRSRSVRGGQGAPVPRGQGGAGPVGSSSCMPD